MLGFIIGLGIGLVVGGGAGIYGTYKYINAKMNDILKNKIEGHLDEISDDMKGLKKVKIGDLDDAVKAIRDKILDTWF